MDEVGEEVVLRVEGCHGIQVARDVHVHGLPGQHADDRFPRPGEVLPDAVGDGLVGGSLSPVASESLFFDGADHVMSVYAHGLSSDLRIPSLSMASLLPA